MVELCGLADLLVHIAEERHHAELSGIADVGRHWLLHLASSCSLQPLLSWIHEIGRSFHLRLFASHRLKILQLLSRWWLFLPGKGSS